MSSAKKNFYAVVIGRSPGIYEQWSGEGGAEEQVKGFPGAVYKGFATRAEAKQYFAKGIKERANKPPPESAANLPTQSGLWAGILPEAPQDGNERPEPVVIYTDGSSIGNPGPGGYGVVLICGEERHEFSGGFRCTTNNRMELLACIVALRQLKKPAKVRLYSDSRYVVEAVKKGWARRWRNNGWVRFTGEDGIPQRAENIDLWEEMLALLDRLPVEFHWVKGHASNAENNRCDYLAAEAARKPNLPPDPGYPHLCPKN